VASGERFKDSTTNAILVKRFVEEYLIEPGLNRTVLQLTHFHMDLHPIGTFLKEPGNEVMFPAN